MEVCGTHTMAIARFGLRDLLPAGLRLVSGPGCPVCVTAMGDLDMVLALARLPEVTLVTFGDLLRVPASRTSRLPTSAPPAPTCGWSTRRATPSRWRRRMPDREVVFVGIGFETTAPTVAAALLEAQARGLANFCILCLHKTMPRPLRALLDLGETAITGFILPGPRERGDGHRLLRVPGATSTASAAWSPASRRQTSSRLCSCSCARSSPAIQIQYGRAVRAEGNVVARQLMERVFEPCDADWRGLGVIPGSGLRVREEFARLRCRAAVHDRRRTSRWNRRAAAAARCCAG